MNHSRHFQETLIHRILTLGSHLKLKEDYLTDLIRVKVEIFEKVKQTRSKISDEEDAGTVSPSF